MSQYNCCGRVMKEIMDIGICDMTIESAVGYLCLKCGKYETEITYNLDEEELKNLMECYCSEEELKECECLNG